MTPVDPWVLCGASSGTTVANVTTSGGNGRRVTLSLNPTGDFKLSRSRPPANIIVATPPPCGIVSFVENLTVTATQ